MLFPAVTATACCLVVLQLIVLTVRVSILRQATGVLLGTANNLRLERAVRAQGNLTESAPVALMLMLLLECSGVSTLALAGLAGAYIASRVAHSIGMLLAERFIVFRALGSAGSLLVLLVGGGMLARRLIGSL